jgi:ABC-type multidrug transport system fused ATPase/permease subunit
MSNFVFDAFVQFVKKYPGWNALSLALCALFPIEDFTTPILTGKIVDAVRKREPCLRYIVALAGILAAANVIYFLSSFLDAKLQPLLENFIRNAIFADVLQAKVGAHEEFNVGEVLSRLIKIPIVTSSLVELYKNGIVPYFIGLVVVSASIFNADKVMGCAVFVGITFAFYMFTAAPRRCAERSARVERSMASLDEEMEDVLRNSIVVLSNGQVENEIKRLKPFEKVFAQRSWKLMMCTIQQRGVVVIVLVATLAVIGFRSYTGLREKTLSIGAFVTIFSSLNALFATLNWLASRINHTVYEWGIIDAFTSFKKKSSAGGKAAGTVDPEVVPSEGILAYHVSYGVPGRNHPILDGVTLYAKRGEKVALVGEIGSGKSTLLKIIAGLVRPAQGSVFIDGRRVGDETNNAVAYIPQHPSLFNRSLYENITYGITPPPDRKEIDALIERTGLRDAFKDLEDGLQSKAGKNGCNLSGGQKQVVMLVRAILQRPDVVLMDEVTASLDPTIKVKVMKLMAEAFKDKTVLFATHDKEFMHFATTVVRVRDGVISSR